MSSATSVSDVLTGYAAGRVTAEQLVSVVAAAYYGARGSGLGTRLKPLVDIIERAHPGVVELSGTDDLPGFAVQIAERPFPKRYESELREAVQKVVAEREVATPNPKLPTPSLGPLSRMLRAVRRLFSA